MIDQPDKSPSDTVKETRAWFPANTRSKSFATARKCADELESSLARIAALEKELAEARKDKNRLVLACPFPKLSAGAAKNIAYHFMQGEPLAGLSRDALVKWIQSVESQMLALDAAMTHQQGAE